MNKRLIQFIWIIFALVLLCLAFFAGRWSESLQLSLRNEANYPWDLHKKLSNTDIQCSTLLTNGATGEFSVMPIENGDVLIIATYDNASGLVTAYAVDVSGRIATDSWILGCNEGVLNN